MAPGAEAKALARLHPVEGTDRSGDFANVRRNPALECRAAPASAPDNFQAQATGVSNVSAARTYSRSNTGNRATVNHSTTTSGGATRLIIHDAAGTIVYDHALSASLNEPTAVGTAGTWTIELRLTEYTGTLNFRAEKL